MALTDEQEKALREELTQQKAALAALQEEARKAKLNMPELEKDKEGKEKERPVKPKVDPDVAKSLAEAMTRIEKLEKRLGDKPSGGFKRLNFFGDD